MSTQEESLVGLVEISQHEARILMEAGYLSIEMGHFKEAQEIFEGCVALLPRNATPHLCLGNLFITQGRVAEAIKTYKDALNISEDTPELHAFLGEAYFIDRQFSLGKQALEKALELEGEGAAAELSRSLLEAEKEGLFQ